MAGKAAAGAWTEYARAIDDVALTASLLSKLAKGVTETDGKIQRALVDAVDAASTAHRLASVAEEAAYKKIRAAAGQGDLFAPPAVTTSNARGAVSGTKEEKKPEGSTSAAKKDRASRRTGTAARSSRGADGPSRKASAPKKRGGMTPEEWSEDQKREAAKRAGVASTTVTTPPDTPF